MLRFLVTAVALFALAPPLAAEDPGSAFELLGRLRQTYAGLGSYADEGEIEVLAPGGRQAVRLRFATRAGAGGFLLRLERPPFAGDPWKVLWSEGEAAYHYDAGRGQVKAVSSLAAEVAHALVEGGQDALVVAQLLAGGDDALDEPEGAALDPLRPCGEGGSCHLLHLSRMGGAVASRLWVDAASGLIVQVEVELYSQGGAAAGPTRVRVVHRPRAAPPPDVAPGTVPGEAPVFTPPPGARRVAAWEGEPAAPPAVSPAPSGQQPEAAFGEVIRVEMLTAVVRVIDRAGRPVPGLVPADFRAVAGRGGERREVPVAAVDWVGAAAPAPETIGRLPGSEPWGDALEPGGVRPAPPPPGRWVLVFVQAHFEAIRMTGQRRLQPLLGELMGSLGPDDRVAVVSFDSHLKLWQDFTRDREETLATIGRSIYFTAPEPLVRRSRQGPLGRNFDFAAAKRAATPERALELAARALVPLAGEKVVIYLGWGLGRFGRGGVSMTPEYRPAIEALEAARAAVFVLDITDADYHSLEIGLENVARDTGGTYAKTNLFPEQAVRELAATLSGHYVLSFHRADLPESGLTDLAVKLVGKKGEVLLQP